MYYKSVQQKTKMVQLKVSVQYMAMCNTVHYSYGKYRKDKVKHYKLWRNMLDN